MLNQYRRVKLYAVFEIWQVKCANSENVYSGRDIVTCIGTINNSSDISIKLRLGTTINNIICSSNLMILLLENFIKYLESVEPTFVRYPLSVDVYDTLLDDGYAFVMKTFMENEL